MKRFIVLVSVLAFVAVAAMAALTTLNSPTYFGKTGLPAMAAAIDTNFGLLTKVVTNITVAPTSYTPNHVGQVLIGSYSNKVWVAEGVTTNSWIALN
jgi:hypothetical protein